MELENLIQGLQRRTAERMTEYQDVGITPGWTYKAWDNTTWVFHSCNDLGVPYFHKLRRKTLFTVPAAESKLRAEFIARSRPSCA